MAVAQGEMITKYDKLFAIVQNKLPDVPILEEIKTETGKERQYPKRQLSCGISYFSAEEAQYENPIIVSRSDAGVIDIFEILQKTYPGTEKKSRLILGAGTQGDIVLGKNIKTGEEVAIKVHKFGLYDKKNIHNYIGDWQNAHDLAQTSQNVVKTYAYGEDQKHPDQHMFYGVMEKATGKLAQLAPTIDKATIYKLLEQSIVLMQKLRTDGLQYLDWAGLDSFDNLLYIENPKGTYRIVLADLESLDKQPTEQAKLDISCVLSVIRGLYVSQARRLWKSVADRIHDVVYRDIEKPASVLNAYESQQNFFASLGEDLFAKAKALVTDDNQQLETPVILHERLVSMAEMYPDAFHKTKTVMENLRKCVPEIIESFLLVPYRSKQQEELVRRFFVLAFVLEDIEPKESSTMHQYNSDIEPLWRAFKENLETWQLILPLKEFLVHEQQDAAEHSKQKWGVSLSTKSLRMYEKLVPESIQIARVLLNFEQQALALKTAFDAVPFNANNCLVILALFQEARNKAKEYRKQIEKWFNATDINLHAKLTALVANPAIEEQQLLNFLRGLSKDTLIELLKSYAEPGSLLIVAVQSKKFTLAQDILDLAQTHNIDLPQGRNIGDTRRPMIVSPLYLCFTQNNQEGTSWLLEHQQGNSQSVLLWAYLEKKFDLVGLAIQGGANPAMVYEDEKIRQLLTGGLRVRYTTSILEAAINTQNTAFVQVLWNGGFRLLQNPSSSEMIQLAINTYHKPQDAAFLYHFLKTVDQTAWQSFQKTIKASELNAFIKQVKPSLFKEYEKDYDAQSDPDKKQALLEQQGALKIIFAQHTGVVALPWQTRTMQKIEAQRPAAWMVKGKGKSKALEPHLGGAGLTGAPGFGARAGAASALSQVVAGGGGVAGSAGGAATPVMEVAAASPAAEPAAGAMAAAHATDEPVPAAATSTEQEWRRVRRGGKTLAEKPSGSP